MEERKTVIQLVGNAHLGIEPESGRAAERAEKLIEKLRHAGDDEVALALCTESRSESGHESPALAALVKWMIARGWSGQTIDLLLIATAQDPLRPSDTAPIAELIERAIRALPSVDPEEYSQMPRIELRVIRIGEVKITSAASAVTRALRALTNIEHVSLMVGPGSVALQAGIFLGCLDAAVRPEIVELNRQDAAGQNMVVNLQTKVSFQRWLARTGRYGALSKNIQNDDERAANMIGILAAVVALDWRRARKLASRFQRNRKLLREFPHKDDDVCELRYWTAFAIRARLAAGDQFAYLWVPRLAQNEFRMLADEHPHEFDAIQRIARECTDPNCGVIKNNGQHCPATVETVMRCPLIKKRLKRHTALAQIKTMEMKLGRLWEKSNSLRHSATATDLERLQGYLNGLDLDARPDENLPHFDLPELSVQGTADQYEKHLMLVAVGKRFWVGGTPFLDALDRLTTRKKHIVLLESPKMKEQRPDDLAIPDGRFVTVSDEAIRSVDQCVKILREHFRRELLAFGQVHVCIAPGTQAMNLALLVVGVELSYETGARLNVHELCEDRSVSDRATPRTSVVTMARPDVRELAPREHLAKAMQEAARVVDLAQLLELTELAPADWREDLRPPAKALLDAAFDKTTPRRARLGLAWKAAHSDPDRGLLWGCAILQEKDTDNNPKIKISREKRHVPNEMFKLRGDRVHLQTTEPLVSGNIRDAWREIGFDSDLLEKLAKIATKLDSITDEAAHSNPIDSATQPS